MTKNFSTLSQVFPMSSLIMSINVMKRRVNVCLLQKIIHSSFQLCYHAQNTALDAVEEYEEICGKS